MPNKPLRNCAFARPALRLAAMLLCSTLPFAPVPAFALSEIPEEDVPASPEITTVPLPEPLPNPGNALPAGLRCKAELPGSEAAAAPRPVTRSGAPAPTNLQMTPNMRVAPRL